MNEKEFKVKVLSLSRVNAHQVKVEAIVSNGDTKEHLTAYSTDLELFNSWVDTRLLEMVTGRIRYSRNEAEQLLKKLILDTYQQDKLKQSYINPFLENQTIDTLVKALETENKLLKEGKVVESELQMLKPVDTFLQYLDEAHGTDLNESKDYLHATSEEINEMMIERLKAIKNK